MTIRIFSASLAIAMLAAGCSMGTTQNTTKMTGQTVSEDDGYFLYYVEGQNVVRVGCKDNPHLRRRCNEKFETVPVDTFFVELKKSFLVDSSGVEGLQAKIEALDEQIAAIENLLETQPELDQTELRAELANNQTERNSLNEELSSIALRAQSVDNMRKRVELGIDFSEVSHQSEYFELASKFKEAFVAAGHGLEPARLEAVDLNEFFLTYEGAKGELVMGDAGLSIGFEESYLSGGEQFASFEMLAIGAKFCRIEKAYDFPAHSTLTLARHSDSELIIGDSNVWCGTKTKDDDYDLSISAKLLMEVFANRATLHLVR